MKPNVQLLLTTSPFLKQQEDTPAVMRQVIYSLIPAVLAAAYFFGLGALLIILTGSLAAVFAEWIYNRLLKKSNSLKDYSALLTGLLLALTLPPGIPLWMVVIGAFFAIFVGKLVFGGLGANTFNPALVGRAFMQASFPVTITTWGVFGNWSVFSQLRGPIFTMPFVQSQVEAVTMATPLSNMKFGGQIAPLFDLFKGATAGSLGETSAIFLLLGGLYLLVRNYINWRIPAAIFLTIAVLAGLLHLIDPLKYAPAYFHLFSGGLMLGAIYMATDPVSSPITHKGCWIFGVGIGLLVYVIRTWGGLPEGVMYAILLMNGLSPLINRFTQPRIYGQIKEVKKGKE